MYMKPNYSDQKIISVLTVDDEPDQLELMALYLEEYDPDIRIDPTSSPEETLQKLRGHAYDCVVADHSMPGMTGLELARRVKETNHVPFILYTGRGSEELASEAIGEGVDDYLRKQADPEHYRLLAQRIRRAVEKFRLDEAERDMIHRRRTLLPAFPKVEVKGMDVIIISEDGSEEVWGAEPNESAARAAAQDIQLNLRAIAYSKQFLADSVNELMDSLMDIGIPIEYLDEVIYEGYRGLQRLLVELSNNKTFT